MVVSGFVSLPRPATLSSSLDARFDFFRVIGSVPKLWGCSPKVSSKRDRLVVCIGVWPRVGAGGSLVFAWELRSGLETIG